MRFTLTISKSLTIDTEEPNPSTFQSLGQAWAEQILEALRDKNPEAQIDTSSPDELIAVIRECIDDDIELTICDFAISSPNISIFLDSHDQKVPPHANPES